MKFYSIGGNILIGTVVCTAILCTGCSKKQEKKVESRAVRVSVQKLKQMEFRRQIPVQGTVTPIYQAVISAKVGGTVETFPVSGGTVLKKGDVLFGIDRQVLKNQVTMRKDDIKVKEAELSIAQAAKDSVLFSVHKAELDYKRAVKLLKSNAISKSDFDSYETEYKKAKTDAQSADAAIANAKAQLKQAESNLDIAEKNLADSTQLAPYDSIVTDTFVEEKEYVSAGQKLLHLENPHELEVICYISAVYYEDIVPGKTQVEFTIGSDVMGKGTITYRAPSIDSASRTFKIKAIVPKNVHLVSGDLCNLNIILESKQAYGLPSDAILLRANNRHIIFAAGEKDIAKSFDVIPGISYQGYSEIKNAEKFLKEDFVVVGQNFVNSGALLQIINRK